ncbi:MAG: sulfite exporter TauE/SafE family protein, partial [Syntrophales bacterium]|nr:sulfite exporter TauE/SafE family protein [Syntrophales bacterium]
LGGVLASFTPCTYPLIPVTAAYIGARGAGSRRKGFYLSFLYGLGMAFTYTVLGLVAAMMGRLFGLVQSSPWTHLIVANVFIFMGLSLLGAVQLPAVAPTFAVRFSGTFKIAGGFGALLVGAVSGLVIGPCTAPVLAAVLGYAAAKQNLLFAVALLFSFSLGLGTLLLLIGTFSGIISSLPGSGPWMERVSRFFGWVLLAVGEYFLLQAGIMWG